MATKRLTDTGIANLNPPWVGRLEIWDAIVPGLGLRVGVRRKTFVERVLNHATSTAGPLAAVYQRYDYAKEKDEALRLWSDEVLRVVSKEAVTGHLLVAAE